MGCVELSIPGRTYGLHDIAMFNLLKVMEICLHENEGNAALTYEGLLEQIRAKISHYITLMVEGSNICDISIATGLLYRYSRLLSAIVWKKVAILPMAARVITSPAYRGSVSPT